MDAFTPGQRVSTPRGTGAIVRRIKTSMSEQYDVKLDGDTSESRFYVFLATELKTLPAEGRYTVTYARDIRETAFDGDDFRYATAVLTVTEAPLAASLTKVDLETGETTRTRIYGPEVGHDADQLWHRVAGLINGLLKDEYEYAETVDASLPPRV